MVERGDGHGPDRRRRLAGSAPRRRPRTAPGLRANGLLPSLVHHSAHTLHDKLIGYPENFIEPPLGYYVREQMTMQVAKADPHRFTLYRTDFLPGTDRFSPTGASRFNLMYSRLHGWLGPVTVEWTPDEPGLAEARRQVVLATLQTAGRPIIPERVVIGPSPYPGSHAASRPVNNFNNMIIAQPAGGAVLSAHAAVGCLRATVGGGAQ